MPGCTSIVVRTRPEGDFASTVHGNGGNAPTSMVGTGAPGANVAMGRPLTNTVTTRVVPFETPRGGRSGAEVCPRAEQDDRHKAAASTRRRVRITARSTLTNVTCVA